MRPGCVAAGEIRPENAAANTNRGSRANANTRGDWSQFSRVDGDFAGTTDEIIQWAACKWGIDEDIARAQVIKESYWYQSANGDNGESWGLGQVRDALPPVGVPVLGQRPHLVGLQPRLHLRLVASLLRRRLHLAQHRRTQRHLRAGDVWGCVGLWFSGQLVRQNDAYLNQPATACSGTDRPTARRAERPARLRPAAEPTDGPLYPLGTARCGGDTTGRGLASIAKIALW